MRPFFNNKKQQETKTAPRPVARKEAQDAPRAGQSAPKTITPELAKFLRVPHVTEKAGLLVEANNQYTFKVQPFTNKIQIKKAIEGGYGVKVTHVRLVTIPSRTIRVGKREGTKNGYKKAIVTLAKGNTIEVISR